MFFETIAKFDTFQFICGTPKMHTLNWIGAKGGGADFLKILISKIFQEGQFTLFGSQGGPDPDSGAESGGLSHLNLTYD